MKSDVVGNVSIRIERPSTARDLIEGGRGDIVYVGTKARIKENDVNLGFNENGSIRVAGDPDDLYEILDSLKEIMFGGN